MGTDMWILGLMHVTIFRGIVGANVQAVWASRGHDRAVGSSIKGASGGYLG